ncbi:MAG TPA: hypothetical protein VLW55_13485 [Burkholderiaceae bacterium]|nr:hypothetical protein [Burkholderiaceae bacterium]
MPSSAGDKQASAGRKSLQRCEGMASAAMQSTASELAAHARRRGQNGIALAALELARQGGGCLR